MMDVGKEVVSEEYDPSDAGEIARLGRRVNAKYGDDFDEGPDYLLNEVETGGSGQPFLIR
jgi:hypothetical protein